MYFSPASVFELPFKRFTFHATSAFCSMITAPDVDAVKDVVHSYQLSKELQNLVVATYNSTVDQAALEEYSKKIDELDTADSNLESHIALMCLYHLFDLVSNPTEIFNLAHEVIDRITDD